MSAEYLIHFGLTEAPFATTPDPRFAYATREHEQAIAKVIYYVEERRGIFLLMGAIGTGKTTISQLAVNHWQDQPAAFTVAHVTNPAAKTPAAFLRLILASFGQPVARNILDLNAIMRGFLVEEYQAGRAVVLLLDEAQTITPANLDTLQTLSNEQTQTAKLIQIVLLSQPNFEFKLTHKPALRSRIAGGATLNPLTLEDTLALLRHRVSVAGGDFDAIFPTSVHKLLYNATNGVPRDLCVLCDAVMFNAATLGSRTATDEAIARALEDLKFKGWGSK